MEPAASYAVVADARTRELGVRVLIGLFIAGSAYLLAPGLYPLMWFAALGTLQVIDSYIASHVARFTDRGPANQTKALYIASTAINSIVYAAIAP